MDTERKGVTVIYCCVTNNPLFSGMNNHFILGLGNLGWCTSLFHSEFSRGWRCLGICHRCCRDGVSVLAVAGFLGFTPLVFVGAEISKMALFTCLMPELGFLGPLGLAEHLSPQPLPMAGLG